MPTGYTYKVADGDVTDLRTFALICARGMGACIMMRDEPNDAPIPDRFEARTSYHDEALAKVRALRAELSTLTPEECERRSAAEDAEVQASRDRYAAETSEKRKRYESLIAQVEAWDCKAAGLKDFMLQQLRESVRVDCGDPSDPLRYYPKPRRLSGVDWRDETAAKADRDIAYHEAERAKEIARTEARNAWLADLRASLPPPITLDNA